MGCAASKKAVDPVDPGPGPPPHLQAAAARTVRLLESLAAKKERVEQPILSNEERRRSGADTLIYQYIPSAGVSAEVLACRLSRLARPRGDGRERDSRAPRPLLVARYTRRLDVTAP